ncbi:hypothetical protein APHAL10511_008237 [Amanita phalloides]|nr:hypothetical protein APHAL10511_008237 [Amanita phalloides]
MKVELDDLMLVDNKSSEVLELEDNNNIKPKKKRYNQATNDKLSPGLTKRAWHVMVFPTFLNYAGSFKDPWSVDHKHVASYLQAIQNFFLAKKHMLAKGHGMMQIVNQWLNKWHTTLCSTAMTALHNFFKQQSLNTQQECEDAVSVNNAITDIPGFKYPQWLIGALALSTAAVEWALKLWVGGNMIINDWGDGNLVEASTSLGKVSTRVHDFNVDKWQKRTAMYIEQGKKVPDNRFKQIVEVAKQFIIPPTAINNFNSGANKDKEACTEFYHEYED